MTSVAHLVIPGQIVATSSTNKEESEEDGFLRGHGTYVERVGDEDRLVASVCGTVQRVNKLITVIPFASSLYQGHVGDLVVGRITSVGNSRWMVKLTPHGRDAQLPLSGVHLPGGVQRVRTAQDQRNMRQFLCEGDLISAEVHKVQPSDGTLFLHTRSYRYSKLENGVIVSVPPSLIPRMKNHFLSMVDDVVDVLWGTNGNIWIQRRLGGESSTDENETNKDLADLQEHLRKKHASTPVTIEERQAISRLRNSIECLNLVHAMVTPENAEKVFKRSIELNLLPFDMMNPSRIIELTSNLEESA
eukprot:CAMPEP_0119557632 /NCGR_PEP_ID=MMETSP1352-20130426/9248_1 /TAXON_ID=265584 /ORGANISM="Stauroneis constricta, Strain CCMP1120" /LENGTH=302 /DNA_ID=CAMNT_0007604769 /DNA_START=41 /DNA_END=949 /DNA_ORIENTATION=-